MHNLLLVRLGHFSLGSVRDADFTFERFLFAWVSRKAGSNKSATAPEPSVDGPVATARSMVSARLDIFTKAKRCALFLAIGSSRMNFTSPKFAQCCLTIRSN